MNKIVSVTKAICKKETTTDLFESGETWEEEFKGLNATREKEEKKNRK
jgi:hypothetical protein